MATSTPQTQTQTRMYAANPANLPRGTLVQLFFEAVARRQPEAVKAKRGGEWHSISHEAIERDVLHAALALEAFGVRRGDRVALLTENRAEWQVIDFGCLCAGVVDVAVYPTLPAHQIAYVLKDCGARMIFVSTAEQFAKIQAIRGELPALEHVVVFDEVGAKGPGTFSLAEFLGRGRAEAAAGKDAGFRKRAMQAKPDDLATILYTSGTTGAPKGVMLSHNNIFSNTRAVEEVLPLGAGDVCPSFLPISHIFQRMVDYYLFWKGCVLAYVPLIDEVGQALLEVKPTVVIAVPRVYEKIYARVMAATGIRGKLVAWARRVGDRWATAKLDGREPDAATRLQYALADRLVFSKLRARTGGRVRFFVSGSAPLNFDIAKFFYSAGLTILEGYGLTETSPVTNVNRIEKVKFGTVGPPVPGTEEMIAEDGEVLVRGPQVMLGYYNNPEATKEVIDADGWFHTGDIGELDEDGYLRITDRKKDLIVTAGGKNVAPAPMENALKAHPLITEAVIVGDRRPYPIVLVVPNYDALRRWASAQGITAADQEALVRDPRVRRYVEDAVLPVVSGFARYERPKKIALLAREFSIGGGELTPKMSVKRRVVEKTYANMIDALYAEAESGSAS